MGRDTKELSGEMEMVYIVIEACTNYGFFKLYIDRVNLGALLTSKECLSPAYLIPRDSKQSICKSAFPKQKPLIQSAHS